MRRERHYPKELVLRTLGYRVYSPEVLAFHRSDARIRIPSAPARTSKSYAGTYDMIPDLLPVYEDMDGTGNWKPMPVTPDRPLKVMWIVAPSYQLAKEFDYVWRELVQRKSFEPYGAKVLEKQNNPNQGNMRILIDFGESYAGDRVQSLVEVKSATNPESCQAEEVDLCLMSEAAVQSEKMWRKYLSTRVGKFVPPTTPDIGAEWLWELIEQGKAGDPSIESFQFTPAANPNYDYERFWEEHARAEMRTQGRRRTEAYGHDCFDPVVSCKAMQDPWFGEQFGGHWNFEGDRSLPFRWTGKNAHVLDVCPPWVPYAKIYVSVDYGVVDPAVAIWWAVGADRQIVAIKEIYDETRLDPQDFVERIRSFTLKHDLKVSGYYGDPQKPEVESFMRKLGLPVYNVRKSHQRDRKSGYMRLVAALTPDPLTERARLHVLSEKAGDGLGCPKTINEWKVLRKKKGYTGSEWATGAFSGRDDAFDCARYFLSADPSGADISTDGWDMDREVDSHVAKVNRMDRRRRILRPLRMGVA